MIQLRLCPEYTQSPLITSDMHDNYLHTQTGLSAFLRHVKKENKGAVYTCTRSAHTHVQRRDMRTCLQQPLECCCGNNHKSLVCLIFYHDNCSAVSQRGEQTPWAGHFVGSYAQEANQLFGPKLRSSTTKKSSSSSAEYSIHWCCLQETE